MVTGIGGAALLVPPAALVAVLSAGVAIAVTRYVSLGSILGTILSGLTAIALAAYADQPTAHLFYGLIVPLFIVISHRDNIERLLRGTERKLGERA